MILGALFVAHAHVAYGIPASPNATGRDVREASEVDWSIFSLAGWKEELVEGACLLASPMGQALWHCGIVAL